MQQFTAESTSRRGAEGTLRRVARDIAVFRDVTGHFCCQRGSLPSQVVLGHGSRTVSAKYSKFNYLASCMLDCAIVARLRGLAALVLSAEDMGSAAGGEPASWWQTAEVKLLDLFGMTRSAFYSCRHVQQAPFARPTGWLSSLEFDPPYLKVGWPTFVSAKFSRCYVGPLERPCGCGSQHASSLRVPCDAGYKNLGHALGGSWFLRLHWRRLGTTPNEGELRQRLRRGFLGLVWI